MDCSTPGSPALHYLSGFAKMSIESTMLSSHLILCHPLLHLPSIFPSIRIFSNELALRIRWPKYWSFSFSSSSSNEYSGLISFRIQWFDLALQETLKSLLQHHNLKAFKNMYKKIKVHSHHVMLHSPQKEWATDACKNIDRSWQHSKAWKI